ncbi:MAG: hypothetical protein SFU57_04485 [Gemmatimonadales bacterium]|nr:hypothetical protein [Gemmatimonadales bacterium]
MSRLETTVLSPVRDPAAWDDWLANFDPDPSAAVTVSALTVVGFVPFDQCRRTLQSGFRISGGDIFVTLTSTEFPEKACLTWMAETRYAVTLTGLPSGAYQVFAIEDPASRRIDGAPVTRVDTLSVGSITIP